MRFAGIKSQSGNGVFPPLPALTNPDSVTSELSPADYAQSPLPEGAEEKRWADYIEEKFKASSEARMYMDALWVESLAYDYGHQWHRWSSDEMVLEDLRDPSSPHRYVTSNQIRPLMLKLSSLATCSLPNAAPAPLTSRPIDRAAAEEGRAINDYCDWEHDGDEQVREATDWCLRTSTAFLKSSWDASADAQYPVLDPLGNIQSIRSGRIGDIREDVLPIFEAFIDPTAKQWRNVRWVIHGKVVPLTEIVQRYGKAGEAVQPEGDRERVAYLNARLAMATGDFTREMNSRTAARNCAFVMELWEKPSQRYPQGVLAVSAGGRLLRLEKALPSWCAGELPFTPLSYQRGIGTAYGRNAVQDLIPLQRTYNRIMTAIQAKLEADKTYIAVMEGSEVGADSYQSDREKEFIFYDRSTTPPVIAQSPNVNPHWFQMLDQCYAQMQNISGVHDASLGNAPTGVTSAIGFQALTQADNSQLKPFCDSLSEFVRRRAEWRLRIFADQCKDGLPRLIGMSEAGDPNSAVSQGRALAALTAGGRARVQIRGGSSVPTMPEAQDQQIMQMMQAGFFEPQNLPSSIAVLDALSMESAPKLASDLKQALAQIQAQQPNPQALQQAQQQHEMQLAQMSNQHQAQLAAIEAHKEIEVATVKAHLQAQVASQTASAPKISLTGKLDSTATVAAEHEAGLPGDVQEQQASKMQQSATGTPPAPNTTKENTHA